MSNQQDVFYTTTYSQGDIHTLTTNDGTVFFSFTAPVGGTYIINWNPTYDSGIAGGACCFGAAIYVAGDRRIQQWEETRGALVGGCTNLPIMWVEEIAAGTVITFRAWSSRAESVRILQHLSPISIRKLGNGAVV